MWYHLTRYSFDSTKTVFGPFKTEEEAWKDMEAMMYKEYYIATKENGWQAHIEKDRQAVEIKLIEIFNDRDDVTESCVFEIDNTKLM